MGVYYRVVNLDKHEILDSPYSAKEGEWNLNNRSAHVVLWAIWRRWGGDRIEVFNDCGGDNDYHERCRDWPNVWAEVEADYLRAIGGCGHKEPAVIYCHECASAVPFDLRAVEVK